MKCALCFSDNEVGDEAVLVIKPDFLVVCANDICGMAVLNESDSRIVFAILSNNKVSAVSMAFEPGSLAVYVMLL